MYFEWIKLGFRVVAVPAPPPTVDALYIVLYLQSCNASNPTGGALVV